MRKLTPILALSCWLAVPVLLVMFFGGGLNRPIGTVYAQTGATCVINFSATTNTPGTAFNNKSTQTGGNTCVAWVVTYWTNSASSVSIQIEGAADSGGAASGSYTALTIQTGTTGNANPATGTTSGVIIACCDSYPWIRLNPTTLSGAGVHLTARALGYVNTSAAKGGGGGAPSGPAGGDLAGTYPNPTVVHLNHVTDSSLANSGLAHPSTTVNSQTCTLGSSCTVTAAPSGTAGGDLGGTYPNPTVTNGSHITNSSIPNSGLVNPATTVNGTTCTLGASCSPSAAPSGTAGGDLSGSYPNPTVAKVNNGTPGGSCSAGQFVNSINTSAQPNCATPTGAGGATGGGLTVYSGLAGVALSNATAYFPFGGGSTASLTETDVDVLVEAPVTVANLGASLSTALGTTIGVNNVVVLTVRKNAADTAVTCTITNPSVSCVDGTHSFSTIAGDLLTVKAVFTGTIAAAPIWTINAEAATSPTGPAGGDLGGTYPNPTVTNGSHITNSSIPNSGLVNPSVTVGGATCTLGGSCTPSGGGSFVLVEQHTASTSAELDFTACISSTYDDYQIEIVQLIPDTDVKELKMQFGVGGTYDTGNNYAWSNWVVTSGAASGADGANTTSAMIVSPVQFYNGANYSMNGTFHFSGPASSIFKGVYGSFQALDDRNVAGAQTNAYMMSGIYRITTAVTSFRFLMSTGNITSGTIRCYGLAK